MKSKKLISLSLTFAFLAGGLAGIFSAKKATINVYAIDINDYTACNEKYVNKDASGLYSALKTIVSPGKSGSYDELYTTYKSAYLKPNGKIFDYYSSITDYDPDKDRAGSYKKEGDCFNREHSIPQSWWGGGTSNQGSDPFIVVPTDGYVNNARGNDPFGMVKIISKQFSNSKTGTSNSDWGYSGTVFEPDDSVKGDFARIYFYAVAKYKAYTWTKDSHHYGAVCFTNNESKNFGLTDYSVKLFSYWSKLDPVSDWEIHVNNAIAPIQKNRNPFIDHPEYADVLWGDVPGYTKYIEEVGVSISSKTLDMKVEDLTTISATTSDGSDITWKNSNPEVIGINSTSTSSGEEITITALNTGHATLTATAVIDDETYSATCEVTINAKPEKELSSITLSGSYKTNFELGDTFTSEGLVVTANYTIGDSKILSNTEYTLTEPDMTSTGTKKVNISYTEDEITKTASYNIVVGDPVIHVTSISLDKETLELKLNEQVRLAATILPENADNKEVVWSSSNESVATVSFRGLVSAKSVGEATITVTTVDGGLTATCKVKVVAPQPAGGGCGGSVEATSIILSTLSVLGIGLLLIKRKFSK